MPLGDVKTAVCGLASHQSVPVELTAPGGHPAQVQPVQAEETAFATANDDHPLVFAQEVAAHGKVEAEDGGDHGNVRPPQSNGGNGDAGTSGAPGSHALGGENGRVRGEAQSGSGRNDVLPRRRAGADVGNVPAKPKAPAPLQKPWMKYLTE